MKRDSPRRHFEIVSHGTNYFRDANCGIRGEEGTYKLEEIYENEISEFSLD